MVEFLVGEKRIVEMVVLCEEFQAELLFVAAVLLCVAVEWSCIWKLLALWSLFVIVLFELNSDNGAIVGDGFLGNGSVGGGLAVDFAVVVDFAEVDLAEELALDVV